MSRDKATAAGQIQAFASPISFSDFSTLAQDDLAVMVSDSYDRSGGTPVIFLNVKHTYADTAKTADELLALFRSAVEMTPLPIEEKDLDMDSVRRELHTSYMASFHALRALDTRRVREVVARFLICTKWRQEEPRSYREVWGSVRVHL